MDVHTIKISKKKAESEWRQYCEILKTRNEKYLRDMKALYFHAKEGRRLLDVHQVFKECVLNNKDEPLIAIAPVKSAEIILRRYRDGSATFCLHEWKWSKKSVELPAGTFSFQRKGDGYLLYGDTIRSKVPVVPARLLKPLGSLKDFYILWEAKSWQQAAKDPVLLKRITDKMFVVFAVWNLTELERRIVRGE